MGDARKLIHDIKVVETGRRRIFEHVSAAGEKTLFEPLPAYDAFRGGTLSVLRDGRVIGRASRIEPREEQGFATCYTGLGGIFNAGACPMMTTNRLDTGDVLRLKLAQPLDREDLGEFLKIRFLVAQSILTGGSKFKIPYDDSKRVDENLAPLAEQTFPKILDLGSIWHKPPTP